MWRSLFVGVAVLWVVPAGGVFAETGPAPCAAEQLEIKMASNDVSAYRNQVARLGAALEATRAERDALKAERDALKKKVEGNGKDAKPETKPKE